MIYFEFLFISLRALLPSFRVINTSHERVEAIKTVRVISEIKVTATLSVIKLIFLQSLILDIQLKFKR